MTRFHFALRTAKALRKSYKHISAKTDTPAVVRPHDCSMLSGQNVKINYVSFFENIFSTLYKKDFVPKTDFVQKKNFVPKINFVPKTSLEAKDDVLYERCFDIKNDFFITIFNWYFIFIPSKTNWKTSLISQKWISRRKSKNVGEIVQKKPKNVFQEHVRLAKKMSASCFHL